MCSNITNSGGGDEKLNLFSGDKERRRGKMQFAKTTLQQIKLSTQILVGMTWCMFMLKYLFV